jgi:hypothetical protein
MRVKEITCRHEPRPLLAWGACCRCASLREADVMRAGIYTIYNYNIFLGDDFSRLHGIEYHWLSTLLNRKE